MHFLVVWLGAIFSSTQTAAIFSDQDISKCLYNLQPVFLIVEQTNRISATVVLAIYNATHVINHAVLVELLRDQTISKCLYNLHVFLAVERTGRISLAGFSNLQCVIFVTFRK